MVIAFSVRLLNRRREGSQPGFARYRFASDVLYGVSDSKVTHTYVRDAALRSPLLTVARMMLPSHCNSKFSNDRSTHIETVATGFAVRSVVPAVIARAVHVASQSSVAFRLLWSTCGLGLGEVDLGRSPRENTVGSVKCSEVGRVSLGKLVPIARRR